jgi:hypothetical protein
VAWDFAGVGVVEDYAGVRAEVVELAADGCGAERLEGANGGGDLAWGAIGVESSVDEE